MGGGKPASEPPHQGERQSTKVYHRADVVHGAADKTPTIVEAVQFQGVATTKTDALIKEVSELYRAQNLGQLISMANEAARHMQTVGLFENVTPLIDTEKKVENGYVVNFMVKEPRNFVVGVKAGMSTAGDADVSVTGSRQSAFGRGERLDAGYTYSVKGDHSFHAHASRPLLGWRRHQSQGASIWRSVAHQPWNGADFHENAASILLSGETFDRKVQHSTRLATSWRTLRASDASAFAVREHAGHTLKTSIENTIAFDNRDRPVLPTKGVLTKLAQEFAGIVGDVAFVKHQLDLQASTELGWRTILQAGIRAGSVHSFADKELHLLDRLYLGGSQDLRGWSQNTIGARAEQSCVGGGASLAGALHIYRPIYPLDVVYLHAFAVSGAVAGVRSRARWRDLIDGQRTSVGLGLAFVFRNTFMLEVNYVQPIRTAAGDFARPGIHIGAGMHFL